MFCIFLSVFHPLSATDCKCLGLFGFGISTYNDNNLNNISIVFFKSNTRKKNFHIDHYKLKRITAKDEQLVVLRQAVLVLTPQLEMY